MHLYVDGGIIGRNPSVIGGTWAFVAVSGGGPIHEASGVVRPADVKLPVVTNNITELLAVTEALEWAAKPKENLHVGSVIVFTDSFVTLCRLTRAKTKWGGVPHSIRDRFLAARRAIPVVKGMLVEGHPTKEQLRVGMGPNGPASPYNVRCDQLCNLAKKGVTS